MIHHGDCLEVMDAMEPESVDAIVTDPPYDLLTTSRNGSRRTNNPDNPYGRHGEAKSARGFMGKTWDGTGIAFRVETWLAALRVAKPGAHLLAFGGTRTVHRMTAAIEDAGWEIRDCLVWAYASGFPKSLNIGDGWGTALKPAWEPIVMARKPLIGTVRANVERHGTGALNIDATRIPLTGSEAVDARDGEATADMRYDDEPGDFAAKPGRRIVKGGPSVVAYGDGLNTPTFADANAAGRWPANVILTDPIFDGDTPGEAPGGVTVRRNGVVGRGGSPTYGEGVGYFPEGAADVGYGDSGTYSRFFLVPKADRSDREPVLGGLVPRQEKGHRKTGVIDTPRLRGETWRQNHHPTVKPTELMRHLVRLVTPPGGLVLDPFLGSGTTGLACEMEGFPWIGIEREAEYVAIAEARLNGTQRGLGLESA